jgi:hypothetical protein
MSQKLLVFLNRSGSSTVFLFILLLFCLYLTKLNINKNIVEEPTLLNIKKKEEDTKTKNSVIKNSIKYNFDIFFLFSFLLLFFLSLKERIKQRKNENSLLFSFFFVLFSSF